MGKYCGRGGHNPSCAGATALVDEVTEDRLIFASSKKYLSTRNQVIDATPPNTNDSYYDCHYAIDMANNSCADMFYSVHLNKAYNSYNGAIGAEIWLHSGSSLVPQATRILKNLENLGFVNRGIKYDNDFWDLRDTNMPAMIIECFFIEATEDVALYKKLGADEIGFAIANGIDANVTRIKKPQEVKKVDDFKVPSNNLIAPLGDNITLLNGGGWIEHAMDGRTIIHNSRCTYLGITPDGHLDFTHNGNCKRIV